MSEDRATRRIHRIPGRTGPLPRLSLALLLLGAAACAGGGWVADHPEVADRARSSPETFVMAAGERWDGLEAIAGSYRLEARRGLGRRSWDLWVVVERPDRVRLEVLGPTASTRALLVAGDAGVALHVVEDAVLYHSPDLEAFERALGLPLDLAEAIGVLLGYGIDPARMAAEISWDEERRRVRVTWPGRALQWLHPVRLVYDEMVFVAPSAGSARNEVEVELETDPAPTGTSAGPRTVEGADARSGGARTAEGSDDRSAGATDGAPQDEGFPIPRVVRLEVPGEGLRLRLERSSTSINPDLGSDVFAVPQVPAVRFLPMEELAREGGLLRRSGEAPEESGERGGGATREEAREGP